MFERFYRGLSRSKDRGGSGLGLAIVKHIVELFGGAIDLQSQVGEGTEIHRPHPHPGGVAVIPRPGKLGETSSRPLETIGRLRNCPGNGML